MRINKWLAERTGLSRRSADEAVAVGRVSVNNQVALLGQEVNDNDIVQLDGKPLEDSPEKTTIMLNKPVGYVCSRVRQGNKTIYELLPKEYQHLNPVGRLDKDSSGLLLLTNDGELAHSLTHPSFQKQKIYHVTLGKTLAPQHKSQIEHGVELDDGTSKLELTGNDASWTVVMHEGRNRQIRRTFEALGYKVTRLHRTQFGSYRLGDLPAGKHKPT